MNYVVTGASRGIGLELVRQLSAQPQARVVAGARHPGGAAALQALARERGDAVRVLALDVADDASVRAFATAVGPDPVHALVNNAGAFGRYDTFEDVDLAGAAALYDTNALGPLRVTHALLPQLRAARGAKVLHVTSRMGSIADNTSGGAYGYRMSKAALNMAARSMALDLAGDKIVVAVVNPGWVKTDMGGAGAPTTVEESVRGLVRALTRLDASTSGHFLDYRDGDDVPW